MIACWQQAARQTRPWPEQAGRSGWLGKLGLRRGPAPARCALELALYDRIARSARRAPVMPCLGCPARLPGRLPIPLPLIPRRRWRAWPVKRMIFR